jgi:hypothetical protein
MTGVRSAKVMIFLLLWMLPSSSMVESCVTNLMGPAKVYRGDWECLEGGW